MDCFANKLVPFALTESIAVEPLILIDVTMPKRASSPAPSEQEVDILDSIYPGGDGHGGRATMAEEDLDFDSLINGQVDADDDGDEAFIALQQAASYRKASNLKGRTVKKGGGFQAMGSFHPSPFRPSPFLGAVK